LLKQAKFVARGMSQVFLSRPSFSLSGGAIVALPWLAIASRDGDFDQLWRGASTGPLLLLPRPPVTTQAKTIFSHTI
jgi:hypothetical protein